MTEAQNSGAGDKPVPTDTQKEQTDSQIALVKSQVQQLFAQLQAIQSETSTLTLPEGQEGTITVAAGTAGTAFLRSKRPLLELLKGIAAKLVEMCKDEEGKVQAVVVTEAQLALAYAAQFMRERIEAEADALDKAIKKVDPQSTIAATKPPPFESLTVATFAAGAYSLGFVLNTIHSLFKILRVDRHIDIFSADEEAAQLLGYMLEAKGIQSITNLALLTDGVIATAGLFMDDLTKLGLQIEAANETLAKISDPVQKADLERADPLVSALKAKVAEASLLLDALHPSKNGDEFWKQVSGQFLLERIKGKRRLFFEVKAQTLQISETRWFFGQHMVVAGEVQIAYRILKANGSVAASGVILQASKVDKSWLDALTHIEWTT